MDINFEKRGMQMKQMNLDAYSPLHKTGHTSKVIRENGKSISGGIKRTIWGMRDWQKY